ncbi:EAL domain-containing protein [Neptuniibacter sp. QD72_48]|uniref:EAL domain-containing protein n=1 Tax=unclassified Neptuniibacter TaxID=2630693 RepID=UPI0039F5F370
MRSALGQLLSRHKKVLLVDKHQQNRMQIQSILERFPLYQLMFCEDQVEALARTRLSDIDFILLSENVSPLPCSTIIADIYSSVPHIPIIVLNQYISEEQGLALIEAKATDFLSTNTLNADLLLRTLRHAEQSAKQNAEIQQLRHSDTLTTAGNRQFFYQSLLRKLNHLAEKKHHLALITIDLDDFRKFNTHYGFTTGDQVVAEMGERIQGSLNNDELFARLGSDEFAIIIDRPSNIDLQATVREYLNKLINSLQQPYQHDQIETQLNCSIGVALAPDHANDVDLLNQRASRARLNAKQIHGCSYACYRPSMDVDTNNPNDLEAELMPALRAEQFQLFFQPRIDLRSGKISGAEALIRWQHPNRGLIMPADFIPQCENNGMIVAIGYWIIYQAGQHLQELKAAGLTIDKLGINLSFRQFKDDMLVDMIKRIIEQEQIDTSVLEFELTESAIFSDEEHVRACLNTLSEEGLTFSLDDFGTGYSSFSLLHKLPISALKIDRSFVSHVQDSNEAAEIVRSIISLAQNMNIKVIAEGVETREQLDFLIQHDCDEIQGYYYSPPISFSDFKQMLLQRL